MHFAVLLALACAPFGGATDSGCAPDTGCAEALTALPYDAAGPLGFSAQEVLEGLGGARDEWLVWEDSDVLSGVGLALALTWSGAPVYHRGCAACGAEPGALLIPATLSLETADGGLAERLTVTLEAPMSNLVSLTLTGSPGALEGNYAPSDCPECDAVSWTLDATLRPETSSGVFGFAGTAADGRIDLGTATWDGP